MSIEPWRDYEFDNEYETCSECGGSGKDNATLDWKCWKCDGIGRIKIKNRKIKNECK